MKYAITALLLGVALAQEATAPTTSVAAALPPAEAPSAAVPPAEAPTGAPAEGPGAAPASPVVPAAEGRPEFGKALRVKGRFQRTEATFIDGFTIDLLSPKVRTVTVTQNNRPLAAGFVSGSTGENFQPLQAYSYVVKVNETTEDLIAKVEIPWNPQELSRAGYSPADTYIGRLAADGMSWEIDENQRNVHVAENRTRMMQLTWLEGEYRLLGRKQIDDSNIFVQYGMGDTRTVNVTGGPGIEESEFIDGLRMSVTSALPARINADVKYMETVPRLPSQLVALYPYAWVINSTVVVQQQNTNRTVRPRAANLVRGTISFPINPDLVSRKIDPTVKRNGTERLTVQDVEDAARFAVIYRKNVNGTFEVLAQTGVLSPKKGAMKLQLMKEKLELSEVTTMDGEYMLAVKPTGIEIGRKGATSGSGKVGYSSAAFAGLMMMAAAQYLF